MHPNLAFHSQDRALMETLIDEIGFGMVFAQTPDGPRVAHTPLLSTGGGMLHFHLARGNALVRHLDGMTALALINGPDAYISPRWYSDQGQVPTWNYLSLELEGRMRRMNANGLRGHLEMLAERQEACIEQGQSWSIDEVPDAALASLEKGIVGFEMEILAWRPTLKLSQNKSEEERGRVAEALEEQGSLALAQLMRNLAS